jgi:hypothetical protein
MDQELIRTIASICTILGLNAEKISQWILGFKTDKKEKELQDYLYVSAFIAALSHEVNLWKMTHNICQELQSVITRIDALIKEPDIPITRIKSMWNAPDFFNKRNHFKVSIVGYWKDKLQTDQPSERHIETKYPMVELSNPASVVEPFKEYIRTRNNAILTIFMLHSSVNQMDSLLRELEQTIREMLPLWRDSTLPLKVSVDHALYTADKVLLSYLDFQNKLLIPISVAWS